MRAALAVLIALNLVAMPASAKGGAVVIVDDRMTVTERVHFQTGNAVFAADAAVLLDDIAAAIKSDADIDMLVVEGHTDSVGNPDTNRALSLKRAEAVVDALAARGVARTRLTAKGFGDTVPIATNKSAAGREANRRVEFTIVVRAGKATAAALPLAKIASRLNLVDAKAPEAPSWQKGDLGLPLYRAWRVNTKEASSADVAFRDTSRIHLRETTLIVIFGDNAYEKSEHRRATLETGALVSRIDELLGGAPVVIDTPAGAAELGRGRAIVATDKDMSRVSNHRGDAVRVRGKTKKAAPADEVTVDVAPGMGTRVTLGEAPEPPRPLPPTPQVDGSMRPTATWDGDVSVLVFAVSPGDAVEVVVEMRDASDQVVFQARAPGTIRAIEARGLPRGDYAVQLSIVDAAGLESIPAEFPAVVGDPPPAPVKETPRAEPAEPPTVDVSAMPDEDGFCSSPLCPLLLGLAVVGGVAATVATIVIVGEVSR